MKLQWSSRLTPPGATVAYSIGTRFAARPSDATIAGRSFVAVRLLPTKRTRSGSRDEPPAPAGWAAATPAVVSTTAAAATTARRMAASIVRLLSAPGSRYAVPMKNAARPMLLFAFFAFRR